MKRNPLTIPVRGYSLGEGQTEVDLDVLGSDDFDDVPSEKSRYDTNDIEALNVQINAHMNTVSNNRLLVEAQNRLERRASKYLKAFGGWADLEDSRYSLKDLNDDREELI